MNKLQEIILDMLPDQKRKAFKIAKESQNISILFGNWISPRSKECRIFIRGFYYKYEKLPDIQDKWSHFINKVYHHQIH